MKKQIRILGIDDSPFNFTDKYATVIGVVMRGGEYLECVLSSQVLIDGNEATTVCREMIQNTKHRQQLKAAMLDGVALGGFNIVDIEKLALRIMKHSKRYAQNFSMLISLCLARMDSIGGHHDISGRIHGCF